MANINKIALITGASRGIGKATRDLFVSRGIEVIAPTRSEVDLLDTESIRKYVSQLNCNIHILINVAGINPICEVGTIDFQKAKELFEINYWACVELINSVAPIMRKQNYGKIVNISSIWSSVSKPGRSIYASSKAAINGFTRSAALELASANILVNSVAPGYVNTELTKVNNTPEQIEKIAEYIPLKRLAEANEISELIYFLCSPANTYITGQTIFIDGGYTIQ